MLLPSWSDLVNAEEAVVERKKEAGAEDIIYTLPLFSCTKSTHLDVRRIDDGDDDVMMV